MNSQLQDLSALYDSLSDEDRARAYSPSSNAPNYLQTILQYHERSQKIKTERGEPVYLEYGSHPEQKIAYFSAGANQNETIFVFIHGGYWQELGIEDSLFAAPRYLGKNISYAAIGYPLAPGKSVFEIVIEVRKAISMLHGYASLQRKNVKLIIGGSSAGAHLAATFLTSIPNTCAEHFPFIKGAVLLSGIYDLRPLVGTYINDALKLDLQQARELSPLHQPIENNIPVAVYWGEFDTEAFKQQSEEYAKYLEQHSMLYESREIKDKDHFDLVFELGAIDEGLLHL
ncbi:alpha/beta hydrolase [Marinomonas ostreistagni]|uniref:Alpha/beta hydrolase n=1 Tax=Marinomonas ostreistagni TaxID=359209 RepID=A0ABS0ZEC2_9GAMM|nr:alpha/beta hydrolase [Marinomonas ostreistagni]MBJ7552030.1 alpha/beta hydrolase [Marinomonas ostreistagni]